MRRYVASIGIVLFASPLLFAAMGCSTDEEPTCHRQSDCPEGEFCRMGVCVRAVGVNDPEPRADTNRVSGARDGGTPGSRDGGATARVDGESPRDKPPESCRDARPPKPDDVVINEILVDVPAGTAGDTNDDGLRDAFDDEFVELVNHSDSNVDARRSLLSTGSQTVELTGSRACLPPGHGLVVFGGLATGAPRPEFESSATWIAESRLSLTNSGGTIVWRADDGSELHRMAWTAPPAESLTLTPQLTGEDYRPHGALVDGEPASPGTCPSGEPLTTGCPRPSPTGDAGDAGAVDASAVGDAGR